MDGASRGMQAGNSEGRQDINVKWLPKAKTQEPEVITPPPYVPVFHSCPTSLAFGKLVPEVTLVTAGTAKESWFIPRY